MTRSITPEQVTILLLQGKGAETVHQSKLSQAMFTTCRLPRDTSIGPWPKWCSISDTNSVSGHSCCGCFRQKMYFLIDTLGFRRFAYFGGKIAPQTWR